jgi:hypothetical protein
MMDIKLVISAVLGATLAVISTSISTWLSKKDLSKVELQLLLAEIGDIKRHCEANLRILKEMDLDNGIPALFHFKKLLIFESAILFSTESIRQVNYKYARSISEIKVIARNINIEIEDLISYLKKETHCQSYIEDHIAFLIGKMEFAIARFDHEHKHLKGKKKKFSYTPKKSGKRLIYKPYNQ